MFVIFLIWFLGNSTMFALSLFDKSLSETNNTIKRSNMSNFSFKLNEVNNFGFKWIILIGTITYNH